MVDAVKDVVLQPRPLLSTKKLLVSIAAGVKLKDLQDWVSHSRFIKVMPNTSSAVGVAASEETVMKEKMWYVISQNEPSLLPISLASKLLTEDCMACVNLLEVILVEHLQRSRRKKRGAAGACILHQYVVAVEERKEGQQEQALVAGEVGKQS